MSIVLENLLELQFKHNCSDMWLASHAPIMVRHKREVIPFAQLEPDYRGIMTNIVLEDFVAQLYGLAGIKEKKADFAVTGKSARYRVCVARNIYGPMITLRLLPPLPEDFSKFGIPEPVLKAGDFKKGLFFVTGPTGSGKTTTLAAMLVRINQTRPVHILTLEDPVEFVFTNDKAFFSQKEVGRDVESFPAGLRSALRENPDVILVGEVRDYETAKLCLEAASTGHYVLATLHTVGVMESINRLVSMFPSSEHQLVYNMLGELLRGIVSQTLLRLQDGSIQACFEFLIFNIADKNIVKTGQVTNLITSLEQGKRHNRSQLLDEQLLLLYKDGKIDTETLYNYTPNLDLLASRAKNMGVKLDRHE